MWWCFFPLFVIIHHNFIIIYLTNSQNFGRIYHGMKANVHNNIIISWAAWIALVWFLLSYICDFPLWTRGPVWLHNFIPLSCIHDSIVLCISWSHHGYQTRVWSEEELDGWSVFSNQVYMGWGEMQQHNWKHFEDNFTVSIY